jgi:hypothetical protein
MAPAVAAVASSTSPTRRSCRRYRVQWRRLRPANSSRTARGFQPDHRGGLRRKQLLSPNRPPHLITLAAIDRGRACVAGSCSDRAADAGPRPGRSRGRHPANCRRTACARHAGRPGSTSRPCRNCDGPRMSGSSVSSSDQSAPRRPDEKRFKKITVAHEFDSADHARRAVRTRHRSPNFFDTCSKRMRRQNPIGANRN